MHDPWNPKTPATTSAQENNQKPLERKDVILSSNAIYANVNSPKNKPNKSPSKATSKIFAKDALPPSKECCKTYLNSIFFLP
jgi:hypothetical protein